MIALLVATTAPAAPVSVTVCIKYKTDFVDASTLHGDDLWTNNAVKKKARGIWFEVNDSTLPADPAEFFGYADNDGCADMDLEESVPHYIQITTDYDLDGRELTVGDGTFLYSVTSSGTISPSAEQVYTYTLNGQATGLEWVNVAAAASYTIFRTLGAWPTTQLYRVAMQAHPVSGDSTYETSTGIAYIDPLDAKLKRTVSHEVGHMLLHKASWDTNTDPLLDQEDYETLFSMDATHGDPDGCEDVVGSHNFTSYEYQSAAASEGFANYIAAHTFNIVTQLDCRLKPSGGVLWSPPGGNDFGAFSCAGAPDDTGGVEYTTHGVDGEDFFGDACVLPGIVTANRGTSLDWTRFFWDVDSKAGLAVVDIVDVLVDSEPWYWTATDLGITLPADEVGAAFSSNSFGSAWTTYASRNGVDR